MVAYFQPDTLQQSNGLLTGLQLGQQIVNQGIQNAYLPQNIQAQLALLRAQTGTQQALPNYYGAMGNEANARGQMFGAQANLLGQETPYLVQQDQANVYSDPILRRLQQAQMAQNNGYISPGNLAMAGLDGAQTQSSPQYSSQVNTQNIPQGTYQGAPQNINTTQFPAGINNLQNAAQQLRNGMPTNQMQNGNTLLPMTPQQQQTLAALRQNMQQGGQMGNATLPPQFSSQSTSPQVAALQNGAMASPQMNSQQQVSANPNTANTSGVPGVVGNPMQNWAIYGSPLGPIGQMQIAALGKGLQTQATSGITQWNDAQDEAAKSADLGTQLSQLTTQFQKNYSDSKFKGGVLGKAPTTGIESIPARLFGGGNLAPEQATDNASQNMAAMVAKMIAGGRVTNYEMQYINNLKPNRAMDPATAQMASDFLKQKSIRMEEQQDFFNAARNQGLSVQNANSLWNMYNNQRPVYDFAQNKPNTQFQKSWQDFLSPQAIVAVQNGQNFVSIPSDMTSKQGLAWFNSLNPADQAVAREQLRQQKLGGGVNG